MESSSSSSSSLLVSSKTIDPVFFPPVGFVTVDESLYRLSIPVLKHHIQFLDCFVNVSFINISGGQLEDCFVSFAEECELSLYNILQEAADVEMIVSNEENCKLWVINTLELLFSIHPAPVMLIGDPKSSLDALLIASLRTLQKWSLTSIFTEFRSLTGRSVFDYEQFIENIDLNDISIPTPIPSYLLSYKNVYEDIKKAMDNMKDQPREKQQFLKAILENSSLEVISSAVIVDPMISLINDKDENED